MPANRLFCFGLGYSAQVLARDLMAEGWSVAGTCQGEAKRDELRARGIEAHLFDDGHPLDPAVLAGTSHLLSSVPPGPDGDPVVAALGAALGEIAGLEWAGYLSTTGVYGDTGGARVDESAPPNPSTRRSHWRVAAEEAWRGLGLPLHVFRLSGIYGPGSSMLDKVRAGSAKRIDKPGHAFSRIHVDDISQVVRASIDRPRPGAIYNLCDDDPAPPAEVVTFCCKLLGVEPPPLQPFDEVAKGMSAMALTFWKDDRRIDNTRIKDELGVVLKYPDYESGLRAILEAGG